MKKDAAATLWARAAEILLLRPAAKVGAGIRVTLAKDEALKAAEHALTLDPTNPDALLQRARALDTIKRQEKPAAALPNALN